MISATSVMLHLVQKGDSQSQNLSILAKRNLPVVLLKLLSQIRKMVTEQKDELENDWSRHDEALSNIYSLLVKLSKQGGNSQRISFF